MRPGLWTLFKILLCDLDGWMFRGLKQNLLPAWISVISPCFSCLSLSFLHFHPHAFAFLANQQLGKIKTRRTLILHHLSQDGI